MTTWTRLAAIPLEDFFSPRLATEAESLNTRIAEVLRRRDLQDGYDARVAAAGPSDLPDLLAGEGDCAYLTLADMASRELELRADLAAFDDRRHAERVKACDQAYAAIDEAKQHINQAVLSIGFLEMTPGELTPGAIQPGMVLTHPSVRAALDAHRTLRSQCVSRDFAAENAAAIAAVNQQLAKIKTRMAPAV